MTKKSYQSIIANYSRIVRENQELKNRISTLETRTVTFNKNLQVLYKLGEIRQLVEFNRLQKIVQNISSVTQSLALSESARKHDFIAMYNQSTTAD